MKIQSLQYEDLSTGWKLDLIEFNPQLTLLVGASGVGKTQILKALINLKRVVQGVSFNGIKWEIKFITSNGQSCKWCGEFENQGFISEFMPKKKSSLSNEKLFIENNLIIDRNKEGIIFEGNKTVKLSMEQSAVYLLRKEEKINIINNDFEINILKNNFSDNYDNDGFRGEVISYKLQKYISLKDIRNGYEPIQIKLYLTQENCKELFKEIINKFIDIFPCVEDIKMEVVSVNKTHPQYLFEIVVVKIKEKGVLNWIEDSNLSSGMWRTLEYVAEIYLCADNSAILIDEFENSLGINCIDGITTSILASERDLQFIITSHHPYIINNIDFHYWKLVTRSGSVVKAEDATKYGIGKSKHQAFIQLANLEEFSEGIAS